jgi:2'-5' RNA ligase
MKWVLLCVSLFAVSCQNQPPLADKKPASLKNYVSLDLEYPEYQETLKKLDTFLGTILVNRGEAHITVITPPEFAILNTKVDTETIHQEWDQWKLKSFKKTCLGEGSLKENKKTLKTYYVVVEAIDLLAFREHLKQKYQVDAFKASVFYPHITLGFTEKDLHFEQGVIKDKKSCPLKLQKLL